MPTGSVSGAPRGAGGYTHAVTPPWTHDDPGRHDGPPGNAAIPLPRSPEPMDPLLRTKAWRLTLLWRCYKLVDTVLSMLCPGSSGRARVCGCDLCRGTADSSLSWHRRRLRRPWGWGDEVGEVQGVARGDEAASVSDSAALGRSVGPASPPRGRCMACNESSGAIGGHHRAVCAVGAETAQDQTRRLWQF